MAFIPMVNRLDVIIKLLEQLIEAITGAPPEDIVIPPPEVVISAPLLPNRYKIFRVDLTEAHEDKALGLREVLIETDAPYVSYMTILEAPSPFTFKVNSTDMDDINAVVGVEWEDFEITEIFVTNTVGTGTALIQVEWRVD